MTEGESDIWLRWLNSKFRHSEALIRMHGPLGLSGSIRLYSQNIHHSISWPTVDFCMFGVDSRLPSCKYTSIFEMTLPGWNYHNDIQAFIENNQWMKLYAGCMSQEELMMQIFVNGDDPDGLLQYKS